jgi:hypothetical protein
VPSILALSPQVITSPEVSGIAEGSSSLTDSSTPVAVFRFSMSFSGDAAVDVNSHFTFLMATCCPIHRSPTHLPNIEVTIGRVPVKPPYRMCHGIDSVAALVEPPVHLVSSAVTLLT